MLSSQPKILEIPCEESSGTEIFWSKIIFRNLGNCASQGSENVLDNYWNSVTFTTATQAGYFNARLLHICLLVREANACTTTGTTANRRCWIIWKSLSNYVITPITQVYSNFTRCIDSVPMQELLLQASESKFQILLSERDVITEHKYPRLTLKVCIQKSRLGLLWVVNKTINYC